MKILRHVKRSIVHYDDERLIGDIHELRVLHTDAVHTHRMTLAAVYFDHIMVIIKHLRT